MDIRPVRSTGGLKILWLKDSPFAFQSDSKRIVQAWAYLTSGMAAILAPGILVKLLRAGGVTEEGRGRGRAGNPSVGSRLGLDIRA